MVKIAKVWRISCSVLGFWSYLAHCLKNCPESIQVLLKIWFLFFIFIKKTSILSSDFSLKNSCHVYHFRRTQSPGNSCAVQIFVYIYRYISIIFKFDLNLLQKVSFQLKVNILLENGFIESFFHQASVLAARFSTTLY